MDHHVRAVDTGRRVDRLRPVFAHPLAWMVIGGVLVFLAGAIVQPPIEDATGIDRVIFAVLGAAVVVALYWAVMRWLAGRRITEFARVRALRDTAAGIGLGATLITGAAVTLTLVGAYTLRDSGRGWWSVVWPVLVLYAFVGIFEELVFRGIMFQALEQLTGSWIALAISALGFGLTHLLAGVTLGNALLLAATGGLLLGAAFLCTRTLWAPIGAHFAWNSTEDILGVDGTPGLFDASVSGPGWLTGATMHLEGSVITVLLMLAATVILLALARTRGHIKPRVNG